MRWNAMIVALGLISLGSNAYAIDWTIGAGVGAAPDYEGSEDYQAVPLWNLRADNLYAPKTYAQILGPTLRSNLLAHENVRIGLSGQYVFKRDDVDNNRVDDLESTDDGVMLGVLLGYDFDLSQDRMVGVEFDARWDVKDDIGGLFTLRAKYQAPFGQDRWLFVGGLETTYATDDYMEEFFEIDAANSARSGLDQFDADAGFKDVGLNASLTYKFTDAWSLTGSATYKRLLNDAEDSPVTDDEGSANQFLAGLLVNYRF
jgi:outer membrane protein